jgi:hypothetical protein
VNVLTAVKARYLMDLGYLAVGADAPVTHDRGYCRTNIAERKPRRMGVHSRSTLGESLHQLTNADRGHPIRHWP